ncbi:MAG: hypothetical protein HRT88_23955 [Lentisphaeraceae bacterium]|nr:hypothetical protein [Lentisphaeraceae bacterium]
MIKTIKHILVTTSLWRKVPDAYQTSIGKTKLSPPNGIKKIKISINILDVKAEECQASMAISTHRIALDAKLLFWVTEWNKFAALLKNENSLKGN